MSGISAGRPRSISRETLEEAACELFLERGYAATSISDITDRAGVSRATFFNYVGAKSDLLWARFDDEIRDFERRLAERRTGEVLRTPEEEVLAELGDVARRLPPENVAFAFAQHEVMGLGDELRLAEARRLLELRDVIARHLIARGSDDLTAEVRAAAVAGALLAAIRAWALAGAGTHALSDFFNQAVSLGG